MSEPREPTASLPTLVLDSNERLARIEVQLEWILKAFGEAARSRASMHEKLEQFGHAAATVARLEPIVTELQARRLQEEGAGKLGEVLAKALYAIAGAAIAVAGWLAHYLTVK